jgi:hypothetical protein
VQVFRPVPHDDDVTDVDAEEPELLGEPGAVPVGHAAGEYLGPGDDDAGARTHGTDPKGRPPPGRLTGPSGGRGYGAG